MKDELITARDALQVSRADIKSMDELLDTAPCGFLTINASGVIIAINATLLDVLGYTLGELHVQRIELFLPVASRIFYHTYVLPLLEMHGRVDEIFISLRSKGGGEVPMLMNAARRQRAAQTVYDCAFMPMHQRIQYEEEILRAKKAANEATRQKDQANVLLEESRAALEAKHAELLAAHARLEALATTDGLTGLKNRRTFDAAFDAQLALVDETCAPLSLLLVDIDHFKQINDTFGHQAGDSYLQLLASLLQRYTRETDIVARYGGEEFAIILPNTSHLGTLAVAEKLRTIVEAETWMADNITISLGAATRSPTLGSKAQLIAAADHALYFSKAHGRNRVTHADDVQYANI